MSNQDHQRGHFIPDDPQTNLRNVQDIAPLKQQQENWPAYYRDYFLRRPMLIFIVIGLFLEVQPYEPIQPSYFIATRFVNREEIQLKGTEDEAAHKEAVREQVTAQVKNIEHCIGQRELSANAAYSQCVQSAKTAGYCRFILEQSKSLPCPDRPDL